MKDWLMNLPCVRSGEIRVDVRGPWPTLIKGLVAAQVECREDVILFVLQHVD
jgi:hypothetical protein